MSGIKTCNYHSKNTGEAHVQFAILPQCKQKSGLFVYHLPEDVYLHNDVMISRQRKVGGYG